MKLTLFEIPHFRLGAWISSKAIEVVLGWIGFDIRWSPCDCGKPECPDASWLESRKGSTSIR